MCLKGGRQIFERDVKRTFPAKKTQKFPEDPSIPECIYSQNSLQSAQVTCDRKCAIDQPRIQCSKRTGRNCYIFRRWRAHLDKMTAQEQMKKMLDELMGTQRDGE